MLYTPPGATSALTLLATSGAIAVVSSVDFAGVHLDGTYPVYVFEFINVVPVVDNDLVYMRTSSDGGTSFDSGAADYLVNVTNGSEMFIGQAASSAALGGICGRVSLFDPASTTAHKVVVAEMCGTNTSPQVFAEVNAGKRNTLTAVNGVRFYAVGGNIASGRINLYGLKKIP